MAQRKETSEPAPPPPPPQLGSLLLLEASLRRTASAEQRAHWAQRTADPTAFPRGNGRIHLRFSLVTGGPPLVSFWNEANSLFTYSAVIGRRRTARANRPGRS